MIAAAPEPISPHSNDSFPPKLLYGKITPEAAVATVGFTISGGNHTKYWFQISILDFYKNAQFNRATK